MDVVVSDVAAPRVVDLRDRPGVTFASPVMSPGRTLRWSRFVDPCSRRSLIVPIDHGLTVGPVPGLTSVREIASWIRHPAINGVIAHKGMVARLAQAELLRDVGVMIHLNGSTSIGEEPDTKNLVTGIERAVRLGADGVSLQVNFRPDNHAHNLQLIGRVVDEADRFGLPTLAMIYPAGPQADCPAEALRLHRHYLRVGFELGVDAIKTAPPAHLEDIPALLDGIGEDVAVLFSGGALSGQESLTELAKAVATSNSAGLCVGRNVFQRRDPGPVLQHLRDLLAG
jgi:class I fructose-bisphosphate aldolase/fructose-bisphosphate aldolase/2-amino-3,7-dideoxy-D-threo-hept-6-ulosonate synthase